MFGEWIRHDVGRVFVHLFDSALHAWVHGRPSVCSFGETCVRKLAVEHDGSVYACERYLDDEHCLGKLSEQVSQILTLSDEIAGMAKDIAQASSVLFVGRRRGLPVAREGAQKLKEISYVHAEAYPSAELKHGPLALISPEMPTVAVVPSPT